VVLGLYFIGALLATGKDDEVVRFLSPFKYFNVTYIIKNAGYEAPYLIFGAIVVIASVIAGYIIYNKKDIHAV
jgi:ABC-2 type transport system permease protein